jgi:hypothetical protein
MCIPLIVARQRLCKNFTAARNTRLTTELLDTSFSMPFVSCHRKVGYLFFPELLVLMYNLRTLWVAPDCAVSNDGSDRLYSDIHLKELWKTTKNLTLISQNPSWDSNLSPPEYNSEVLPLEPICSVFLILKNLFYDMGISETPHQGSGAARKYAYELLRWSRVRLLFYWSLYGIQDTSKWF